jgi:hypothetical protein
MNQLDTKYWKSFYNTEWVEIFSYRDEDQFFCHFYKKLGEYHFSTITNFKNSLIIILK